MQPIDNQSVNSIRANSGWRALTLHLETRSKLLVSSRLAGLILMSGSSLPALTSCTQPGPVTPTSSDFFAHQLWDDGLAEFNRYQGREIRYGAAHKAEVIHILVSEHFSPRSHVKADDPAASGTYAVLKLNQVIAIQTGVYRYQQMTSHFWRREDGRLLRFNLTSGDSCGNTFKDVQRNRHRPQRFDYRAQTYWEGMEDVRRVLDVPTDGVFYDELPAWVRAVATDHVPRAEIRLQLAATVIRSKSEPVSFEAAGARIEQSTHKGEPCLLVTLAHAAGTDRFVLEPEWPHVLRRWDKADGGWLELIDSRRIAYWEMNQPEDTLD